MKVYCPYCKKEVEYKIEKRELKEFRGIEVNTFENVAICNECNQDLYVNKIEEEFYDITKRYLAKIFKELGLEEKNIILDQLLLPFNLKRINSYFRVGKNDY